MTRSRIGKFFHNTTVYISGGSSGIGLACAELLVPHSARLVLMARDSQRLDEAAQALRHRDDSRAEIHTIPVDVCDAAQVKRGVERGMRHIGTPDVLIHSAGYAFPSAFESTDMETVRRIFDTNVIGTWNMLHNFVPTLQRGAMVIHIASFAALLGVFGYSAYAASKYATLGLCEVLRNELSPRGITLRVACPSDTDTPQLAYENRHKPPETAAISGTVKPYSPRYVARYILTRCWRRSFLIIPGVFPKVIWFLKRMFPPLVYGIVDRKLRRYLRA